MRQKRFFILAGFSLLAVTAFAAYAYASSSPSAEPLAFPPPLESYNDSHLGSVSAILIDRIKQEPFNLVVTLIFLCAIIHTFMASKFMNISHRLEHEHEEKIKRGEAPRNSTSIPANALHFLGEVEVVFGLWSVVLCGVITAKFGWSTFAGYVTHGVNFTEPAFVVVIMALAATRPILKLAEAAMWKVARLFGGTMASFWLTILTIGPLLGSFITEPAAITISALVLSEKFYSLNPSTRLKYATLGLLFVNISVGGTLTHFAAPPVLMVSAPWNWGTDFMLMHFGWKAFTGIIIANGLYFLYFRKELARLQEKFALQSLMDRIESKYVPKHLVESEFEKIKDSVKTESGYVESISERTRRLLDVVQKKMEADVLPRLRAEGVSEGLIREAFEKRLEQVRLGKMRRLLPGLLPEDERPEYRDPDWDDREDPVPLWVTVVHLLFMGWTIVNSHNTPLFMLGLLFFLGFAQISAPYQNRINLQSPILVGFFLAGLVIHGGLQGWWIAPVLGSLGEVPLILTATVLTAFNDNAAITYLSTLVPDFTDGLKYAVVAGAVTGGGLTVIANAPNPAGQAILRKHFGVAVSPLGLFLAALLPTIIMLCCFLFLG